MPWLCWLLRLAMFFYRFFIVCDTHNEIGAYSYGVLAVTGSRLTLELWHRITKCERNKLLAEGGHVPPMVSDHTATLLADDMPRWKRSPRDWGLCLVCGAS